MILGISRTSTHLDQPCKEAFQKEANDIFAPWFIEFNSLDELMLFVKKHEKIVVTKDSIEIYDTYRE